MEAQQRPELPIAERDHQLLIRTIHDGKAVRGVSALRETSAVLAGVTVQKSNESDSRESVPVSHS